MAQAEDDVPPLNENPEEPLLQEDTLEETDRQPNPEDAPPTNCCGRFCFHKLRTRKDIYLLLLHLFNFMIVAAICTAVDFHRKATKGLCLTASTFTEGGIVGYETSVVWCNLLLYVCIQSASMSWVSIVVKWTAQAYGSVRWLKADFMGSAITLLCILGVLVAQSVRFGMWCSDMNGSLKPYATYYNMTYDHELTHLTRCQRNAKQIDKNYPEIVQLDTAFKFTVGELVLSCLHLIMWCIIVQYSLRRMNYQIKVKRDQEMKIQRETLLNAGDDQQFIFGNARPRDPRAQVPGEEQHRGSNDEDPGPSQNNN